MIKKVYRKLFFAFLGIILIGIVLFFVVKSPSFQFLGEVVSRVNTNRKVIALTFDDGPSKKTDAILKILKDHDIKATFFLNGDKIERFLPETKKIALAGHQIGNHSYHHKRLIFKSYSYIKNQIEKTDSLIRLTGYKKDIYFRPPYGKKFLVLPYYLNANNRKTIMWDVGPESFTTSNADSKKNTNYTVVNNHNGSIVLLHVMYGDETLKFVTDIIIQLKNNGYTFKTVEELLEYQE